ncbi:hypothetical protein PR048_000688 [Dryococelus australis]|uniref:Uncharacterized protein n=1 Tax=Dryococelus australis TaxID=614101 RepID=A0ABQ9IG81_9NEOP|nr:hypothetical protein PR048_000688 [Dryococelus australis]
MCWLDFSPLPRRTGFGFPSHVGIVPDNATGRLGKIFPGGWKPGSRRRLGRSRDVAASFRSCVLVACVISPAASAVTNILPRRVKTWEDPSLTRPVTLLCGRHASASATSHSYMQCDENTARRFNLALSGDGALEERSSVVLIAPMLLGIIGFLNNNGHTPLQTLGCSLRKPTSYSPFGIPRPTLVSSTLKLLEYSRAGEGNFVAAEKAIPLSQGKSKIKFPPSVGGYAERTSNPPAAAVAERLDCSPPTTGNWVQSPGGSLLNFSTRESCRAICRWAAGFLRDLPFPPPCHYGAAPFSPHFILFGSYDLVIKSRPNLSTQFSLSIRPGLEYVFGSSVRDKRMSVIFGYLSERLGGVEISLCFDLVVGNISCSDAQLDRRNKAEDSQTVDIGKRSKHPLPKNVRDWSPEIMLLVHTVFNTSWRTLAQSSPSTVTADNQCTVGIGICAHKTVKSSLQVIEPANFSGLPRVKLFEYEAAPEFKGGENGISPRKPTGQRNRSARFPRAKLEVTPPGIEPGLPWARRYTTADSDKSVIVLCLHKFCVEELRGAELEIASTKYNPGPRSRPVPIDSVSTYSGEGEVGLRLRRWVDELAPAAALRTKHYCPSITPTFLVSSFHSPSLEAAMKERQYVSLPEDKLRCRVFHLRNDLCMFTCGNNTLQAISKCAFKHQLLGWVYDSTLNVDLGGGAGGWGELEGRSGHVPGKRRRRHTGTLLSQSVLARVWKEVEARPVAVQRASHEGGGVLFQVPAASARLRRHRHHPHHGVGRAGQPAHHRRAAALPAGAQRRRGLHHQVHAAQRKHCTPVQRLARRSERASAACVNVVLIGTALPFLKRAKNVQVGGALKQDLQQPVASIRHTFVRLPAEQFTTKLRTSVGKSIAAN